MPDRKEHGTVEHRVCGAHIELHPAHLAALRVIPGDLPEAGPGELHGALRCALEADHSGRHYGLARSLPMDSPGEVWACWSGGRQPSGAISLPDCAALNPADPDEACVLFNEHAGEHSWALADPEEDALRSQLGLF
ncbi:hypothetical protein ITI46_32395 [Streptomyces oryzae]|uniref:Uncharacterized protein n=1 Tax=Streptomyces oryzae TaxID=1434886 RepID=A0ABS3XLU1_9ACTN|nr:hypothetical protein [Streptomyces oryzae]MBO8196306.1 hypothetical protein [Streptomyces oryzae]